VSVVLRQFQQEAVDKVGTTKLASRLLGDDMGLGKTYQALVVDCRLRRDPRAYKAPTLIVAPLGVHESWERHIKALHDHWKPPYPISIIDPKKRGPFVASLKEGLCYYIVHYEALRLIPELREVNWFHIIADETHRIKNRKAQNTRAMKALPTLFKTGVSGTAADNMPQDLWSVLNWLYPRQYSSYWRFVKTYCIEELTQGRGATFRKIVGVNPDTIGQLHAEMRPWFVRRLKANVLKELPDKIPTDRYVNLYPSQRRAYDQMRKDMIAWIGEREDTPLTAGMVVSQLVRLQQFALASPIYSEDGKIVLDEPSSKLDSFLEIEEDNPDEQIVVFSQSRSMVELVARKLAARKVPTCLYTGKVPKHQRDYNVQAFQGGDFRVLAATIAAGGEGITLTASSTVVFLDRHWNPTKNIQAEDRLHRIGQDWPVQVIDIIARDTVDLGRRAKIAAKWSTLKLLLGDNVDIDKYAEAAQEEQDSYRR
jgi:SNF2 family DNA or RNA helicase